MYKCSSHSPTLSIDAYTVPLFQHSHIDALALLSPTLKYQCFQHLGIEVLAVLSPTLK